MCVSRAGLCVVTFSTILLAGAVALMAASAAGVNDFFYYDVSFGTGTVRYHLGAFQLCEDWKDMPSISYDGPAMKCHDIDKDCKLQIRALPKTEKEDTLEKCDQYNAMRGLLIIAIILAGLAFVFMFLGGCICPISVTAKYLGFVFALLGGLCGMVSMAILLDYMKQTIKSSAFNTSPTLGLSFILEVIGWPLAIIGSLIHAVLLRWWCTGCVE